MYSRHLVLDSFHTDTPQDKVDAEIEVEMKDPWEVDRKYVTYQEEVGKGAFGKVFKAILKQPQPKEETVILAKLTTGKTLSNNKSEKIVAVKTLKEIADSHDRLEFVNEINLMKKVGHHKNIVNILGCCTSSEPYFLLVEYLPKGDLLKYLRANRHREKFVNLGYKKEDQDGKLEELLTPKDLISFSYQVASGMEYLTNKGFVHRDLAARNVLVADNKQVKVSDFGLTRALYEDSAYRSRVQRRLPIKWMAPEAIHDLVFTAQSDV
ncbi:hypothetical protein QZH41_016493 [Actinostola sp. cb2023]|nr:hypothetical protein QZH41_016493 [Actinostola sp. cb2023]